MYLRQICQTAEMKSTIVIITLFIIIVKNYFSIIFFLCRIEIVRATGIFRNNNE